MNKRRSKVREVSDTETESDSDESVNTLAEQVKDLIGCGGRNVLVDEIRPPKLRPSVVHRAFKKNITSTPLVAKGYRHFFASDSSLSPIRASETREFESQKKSRNRRSTLANSPNLKKNEAEADNNHDQYSHNVINDKNNSVNSKKNVAPEISTDKPRTPSNSRISRSSHQKSTNNITHNSPANGTCLESVGKINSTTSRKSSNNTVRNSLTASKIDNARSVNPEVIADSDLVVYADEEPEVNVANNSPPNLSVNKSPSFTRHKTLTPKSELRKSINTPDNRKSRRETVSNKKIVKSAAKSFLPVRIPSDPSKGGRSLRLPLQVQNSCLGNLKETVDKVRSKSVDFVLKTKSPLQRHLSNTVKDKLYSDGLDGNEESSDDGMENVSKPKAPVPKPRRKKTAEITNTEQIYYCKPRNSGNIANKSCNSNSSDSVNKQQRLLNFINKLSNKNATEQATNVSQPVLSRSVQTSYRKSLVEASKRSNKSLVCTNRQEMQTQTSYRYPLSQNESSDGSISNYTGLIEDCARVNIFDSLKPPNIQERFSSSFEDNFLLENSRKPWRVDEELGLSPRNSVHLSFIKRANLIEAQSKHQLEAIKRLRQYKYHKEPIRGPMFDSTLNSGEDDVVNETLVEDTSSKSIQGQSGDLRKNPSPEVVKDAVSEWVANVNNNFTNTDEDDHFEELVPEKSPETTLVNVENKSRSKVSKTLFQNETLSSKKNGSRDLQVVLDRADVSEKNTEAVVLNGSVCSDIHSRSDNEDINNENISVQFTDVATRLEAVVEKEPIKESDGLFKVPTKKPSRSRKKDKTIPVHLEDITESGEGNSSGLRKSSRTRRPPKRRYAEYVIVNHITKSDVNKFAGIINDTTKEMSSNLSLSMISSILNKKSRQTKYGDESSTIELKSQRLDTTRKKSTKSRKKLTTVETHSKDEQENEKENVGVEMRVTTRKKKGNKKKSVAKDATKSIDYSTNEMEQCDHPVSFNENCGVEIDQEPQQLNYRGRKTDKRGPGDQESVRVTRSKSSTLRETNDSVQPEILDTSAYTLRNKNNESYQYSKITNPGKYISSDSGRSTLQRSSIDEKHVKTGRVMKTNTENKRTRKTKSVSKDIANEDGNNVGVDVNNYTEVHSETGLGNCKYVEENPKFNQCFDKLKYSDPLDHTNGASMVYLEIPPGEIKKKHTNKKHNLFYCVIEGRGRVYISKDVSGIKKTSRFIIPTGLCYSIINDSINEPLLLSCVRMPIS